MRIFSKKGAGFSLVELLLVITIIGLLASIVLINLNNAREHAKVAEATATARTVQNAVTLYHNDMGFFPPEVRKGWEPGLTQPFPNDPETGKVKKGVECAHCPPNWQDIIEAKWDGPYIGKWPQPTPWGGFYDYNYWDELTGRSGCQVLPGIYIGVERDKGNKNPISSYAEQIMINKGYDDDGCLNGEAQLMLFPL